MTVVILGDQFDEIVPEIQKALDLALANTLDLQQTELNKQPPFDSGRMASSWRIGKNSPRLDADRGEDWESGVGVKWEYEGKITFDGTWYISNNLPYSRPVADLGSYPKSWGGKKVPSIPKDWFSSIANQTLNVFNKEYNKVKP